MRTCTVEECDKPYLARGMCNAHWLRWKRHRSTEKRPPGVPKREYPADLVEQVRALYESGMTREEVDARFPGVRIQTLMRNHGIETRRKEDNLRHDAGPAAWQESVSYGALHARVRKMRGTPSECEWCGVLGPQTKYHWANLSGDYEDITDYVRLCVRCHHQYDAERRAQTGKNTMAEWGRTA